MASFSVVNNISSANAQANLNNTSLGLQKAIQRLSSGYRINQAGDDAAGLAVANTYRSTQTVLNQGIQNANDGLSTLQIEDGALSNISTLLDRLSTLASESASAASSVDRGALNNEFQDVLSEIDREANVAGLNSDQGFSVFVSNDGSDGTIGGSIGASDTTALGLKSGGSYIDISSVDNAKDAVSAIADAVTTLGTSQSSIGTLENRLQYAISLAQQQVVSNQAAESRIRDANVATESANLTKYNILTQSGVAALAQANQSGSAVLSLLR